MKQRSLSADHCFPHLWSVSFADLMMLLLAFFVLRYSLTGAKRTPDPVPVKESPSTPVASILTEPRLRFDNLFSDPSGSELSFSGSAVVRALAKRVEARKLTLEVVVYAAEPAAVEETAVSPRELARQIADHQSDTLTRQILDAGLDPSRLRLGWEPVSAESSQSFQGVEFLIPQD